LVPLVLGPEGVPVVTDAEKARRLPELAVLSVMAHGQGDVQTAVNIAQVAASATAGLASDNQALYLDLIEAALGDAARKAFEMLPETYKFQGPSYSKGRVEGRAEGRVEGLRDTLHRLLTKRFGELPSWVDERTGNGTPEELTAWFDSALAASCLDDVFQPAR
jgi:hypothetical protein